MPLVCLFPGPPPRSSPPIRALGRSRGQDPGRGGSRGADSPISPGTPRRPPPPAPASTRSPPLTHRGAASSGRRLIYAAVAAGAQGRYSISAPSQVLRSLFGGRPPALTRSE
ncbi:hypothetical protein NDU88_001264 [Pleurodeles waltl]|uniref:Uncharacterized protein n=1 Tax=Pleurodeles waltl TaxID=8319 RepID=A0AAV7V7B3_PLEWA|nr:hypothetical protein NDU88_001264 [Pleurodeles waltl]